MFRNVTFYRFPASVADSIREIAARDPRHDAQAEPEGYSLQAMLSETAAKPCGAFELQSRGWASPYGDGSTALFQRSFDCVLLALGGEDKILPASVVNDQLRKRLAELEKFNGRWPSGKARKQLKEDLIHELLPRALCKPYRLAGYLDLTECFLAVDTSSRKAAEAFVSQLRAALGSFPALPLNAEESPRAVLTGWVAGDPTPEDLWISTECELRESADNGAVVKCQRIELGCDDVQNHLEAGMKVSLLALEIIDRLSFTLGDDLVIRKLKMLDAALDSLDGDRDDVRAEIDARFALLSGEVRHLFRTLAGPFKFSTAEG